MDIDAFWNRVKVLIKTHKTDQIKFAENIGIPIGTLRSWIHYGRAPDFITAFDIASALGVSLEYLAKGSKSRITREDKKNRITVKKAIARMRNEMEMLKDYI